MAVSIFPTPRTVAAASASTAGGNVFRTTITATGESARIRARRKRLRAQRAGAGAGAPQRGRGSWTATMCLPTDLEEALMADFPAPKEGIVLTHFIVSDDVERSRRFYTEVLGGETVLEGEPSIVALANGWVIINVGGGPTEDKPTVTLETLPDPDRTSSFLNIRVADIQAAYDEWSR